MFALRNLRAVEEASVYFYFPTLVHCDKEEERTSCLKSVKVHTRRKQNKIKVKQKIFNSRAVNAPRRIWNLWVYTDRMCKAGTEPPCDSFITTKTNCSAFTVLLTQQNLAGHPNTSEQHPNAAEGVRKECGTSGWRAEGAELMLPRLGLSVGWGQPGIMG